LGMALGMTLKPALVVTSLAMAVFGTVHAQQDSALPGYRTLPFSVPAATQKMLIVDADGDGLSDLMTIVDTRINLHFQRPSAEGFDFAQPDTTLELPWSSVGWELSRDSSANDTSLLALVDGNR